MSTSKILVVDDEEIVRNLLGRTLGGKGYAVETVEDGDAALEKVKKDNFNLLITDLKMPRISGMDVLRELKKVNPYIEVIIITGYPTIDSAVEAIKIGAFDFICKPFDIQATISTIERSLEKQKFNISHFQLSELMILFEVSKTMTATANLDDLLARILDSALEITKAKRGSLLLIDEKTEELAIKIARGLSQEIIDNTRIKLGEGISGRVAQEGTAILVTDIETDPRFQRKNKPQYETKSFLGVPLTSIPIHSQKNVLGVINISDKISGDSFTEREQTLLSVLADQAAVAIENAKLYRELQNKIEDLKQTIEKLNHTQVQLIQSEKLAALGRFSSGIAHEVKNPLGIIVGGVEFLELKLSQAEEDVRIALQKIKESTLRADAIIKSLLRFARPSELKTESLKPQDLIEDTLSLVRFRSPLIDIKIETDFAQEPISIEVDKNQMSQVFFNILMNAVEAMPNGGQIKIKTYKTAVTEFSSERQMCVIEVIDSGEGISKDNLLRLFEPFFTTKRDKKGTGLGLFMSKMIVEKHKGKLTIESEVGRGTTAKIALPI